MTDHPRLPAGLLARRRQLAQEISAIEAKLRQHYETLQSLDHLIRLEDEDVELSPVPFSALDASLPRISGRSVWSGSPNASA
jgi:hypothetical protein